MENKIFLSMLVFLVSIQMVLATPVIQNVSVSPSALWLGEETSISLECFDNANKTITDIYADITGPGIILPTMFFTPSGGDYVLLVDEVYLDRTGQFDVTISCENNESEQSAVLTGFTVSELEGYVNIIDPSPAYIGDITEIDFIVKKDGVDLSSGVTFDVKFNGISKSLKVNPAYDTIKGWILKLDSPTVADNYDVEVTAFYDRTNTSDSKILSVYDYIQFEIVSLNKEWVDVNDDLTVTLKAFEGGSIIALDEDNIEIDIGPAGTEIENIKFHDNVYDVKIIIPTMSSGTYYLEATLTHDGSTYSDSQEIAYVVPIEGEIVDQNNKGISVSMKFIKNDVVELSLITDAFGSYSKSLPPDTYDVELTFPRAKLYLYRVIINSFDDPVKYYYSHDVSIPGIKNAGLHDFGVVLPYSSADIEIKYVENNVVDETELKVFKCSNWNSGRKICNEEWDEIMAEIDVVRNLIELEASTLSAFVIGTLEELNVDFSLDKEIYNLEETVTVTGIIKDSTGKTISDAFIDVIVENTDIDATVVSDNNGIISVKLPVPEKESNYTLSLVADKYPYIEFEGEKSFLVSKSRSIYINFPDTIKVGRGKKIKQDFSLINIGQDSLRDLTFSLEGIPENFYTMISNINEIKSGEERGFQIEFSLPEYIETGISSVSLIVSGDEIYREKIFGFNVVDTEEGTVTEGPTGFATNFRFPNVNLDIVYIILVGTILFVFVLILNKVRTRGNKRSEIKSFLSSVRSHLKKGVSVNQIIKDVINYDELIVSEFPNALKKINRGDKYSKNN